MPAPTAVLMPIVSFEKKPMEDRDASIGAGKRVMKDVDFITFIPSGAAGKTKVEYNYTEWLERIQREASQGDEYNPSRFPQEWLDRITFAYSKWSKGEEVPLHGTALKNWPAISPAEYENCKANDILTVEQLAAANDHTVMNLGMGGRALVERAKATVLMSTDSEATAAKLAAAEADRDSAQAQVADLQRRLAEANTASTMGVDARNGTGADMQAGVAATGAAKALPGVIDGKKPAGEKPSGDSGDAANSPGQTADTTQKPETSGH